MNEINIYKQIESLQEQIYAIAKMTSDQADQITPIIQGATVLLAHIERHEDLMASLKKDIETLKAEIQRQGESLAFLKQTLSH